MCLWWGKALGSHSHSERLVASAARELGVAPLGPHRQNGTLAAGAGAMFSRNLHLETEVLQTWLPSALSQACTLPGAHVPSLWAHTRPCHVPNLPSYKDLWPHSYSLL